MSDTTEEFLEGAHSLSHARAHKLHNLRAQSGYPLQYGIGAFGSPYGAVTGVQVAGSTAGATTGDGDNDSDDHLSPDQFGNVSAQPDNDGDAAPAGAGGSGTSGGSST